MSDVTLGSVWDEIVADLGSAAKAHVEYQTNPIRWAWDKLAVPEQTLRWSLNAGYGSHVWDGTPDPLSLAFEAIADWEARGLSAGGGVAIESATSTGKSYGVAVLILWFLACFERSVVFTFAPKEDQLRLYIWKNITELWPRFSAWFPRAELTDLRIRMTGDDTWAAHGYAVQVRAGETISTRAQGMHAEHMLLVYEETPGIDASVLAAGKNTCTAPHNLRIAIGNPNSQLDALHLMTEEAGVVGIRMSALDHPNVITKNPAFIPGAVSAVSIAKRLAEYGDTSPVYQSRVRGVSPEQASDAMIRVEWLKKAAARYDARAEAGTIPTKVTGKGVDVANSEHGDQSCIVDFAENVCIRIDAQQCPDANVLGRQVVLEALAHGLDARRVGVDAIGVGAGTINEAKRLKFFVTPIYNGGKPMQMIEKMPDGKTTEWSPDANKFENLRGQTYWQTREDLRLNRIDVPKDLQLWRELTSLTFIDEGKVVKVLPKDEIKKILGRSPDKADAFVMGNWVRARTATELPQHETPQGVSLGLDPKTGKPKKRLSADEEMAMLLGRGKPGSPTLGRNRIPFFGRR